MKLTIGYALTGSYCTHATSLSTLSELVALGHKVIPIASENTYTTSTRFGTSQELIEKLESITSNRVLHTIPEVEPIGPKNMLDILVVAPCTGNTLGKLSTGIFDTSVTMACKAHLRNLKPLLLAPATNDALGISGGSIIKLMQLKNIYFVPMFADDPENKPNSLIAHFDMIPECIDAAMSGRQLVPVIKQ